MNTYDPPKLSSTPPRLEEHPPDYGWFSSDELEQIHQNHAAWLTARQFKELREIILEQSRELPLSERRSAAKVILEKLRAEYKQKGWSAKDLSSLSDVAEDPGDGRLVAVLEAVCPVMRENGMIPFNGCSEFVDTDLCGGVLCRYGRPEGEFQIGPHEAYLTPFHGKWDAVKMANQGFSTGKAGDLLVVWLANQPAPGTT
jgi:hypothetical protein